METVYRCGIQTDIAYKRENQKFYIRARIVTEHKVGGEGRKYAQEETK